MFGRGFSWTSTCALALACGPASHSSGPSQNNPTAVGGTAGATADSTGAVGPGGAGGSTNVAASGGTSAEIGTAGGGATVQTGGTPATSAGGVPVDGAGGAVIGGAGGGSGGTPAQSGPAPLKYTIAVPNVAPGDENTQCLQVQLPNTTPISVVKLHNVLSEGSHHFIVSAINTMNAAVMPLTQCKPFRAALQGGPLAITQRKDDTITTPPGVGYGLNANQIVSLELHYINTTSDTLDVQAETEIYPADAGASLQDSTVLLIGTTNFSIAPQSTYSTGPRYIAMPSALAGVNYFAITGHTHRLGTAVKVGTAASATATPTSIYAPDNYNWDSPALEQLNPPAQVPSGGGFVLQCDWNNTTDSTITWGESALNEMCFFWAYYYPKASVSNLILEGIGPVDPNIILTLGI